TEIGPVQINDLRTISACFKYSGQAQDTQLRLKHTPPDRSGIDLLEVNKLRCGRCSDKAGSHRDTDLPVYLLYRDFDKIVCPKDIGIVSSQRVGDSLGYVCRRGPCSCNVGVCCFSCNRRWRSSLLFRASLLTLCRRPTFLGWLALLLCHGF